MLTQFIVKFEIDEEGNLHMIGGDNVPSEHIYPPEKNLYLLTEKDMSMMKLIMDASENSAALDSEKLNKLSELFSQ